jgi:two-component system, NarL family, response regulator NreC
MKTTILLADDHMLIRHGLRAALATLPDVEVVGEAGDGAQAEAMAAELRPKLVMMDIHMPGLNGTEATRRILRRNPRIKVLALSMYAQKRYVLDMLSAGAMGFALKSSPFEELTEAIRAVASGRRWLSPEIRHLEADSLGEASKPPGLARSLLTPREREVVQLVAEGRTSKAIAERLFLSETTVETHRRQIMRKLGLGSVAELTQFAVREGLLILEP